MIIRLLTFKKTLVTTKIRVLGIFFNISLISWWIIFHNHSLKLALKLFTENVVLFLSNLAFNYLFLNLFLKMNDVFIYLSGLEILTKMLKHLSIFICLLAFHLIQMRNSAFHMK
jgi:hypothetical protein